MWVLTDNGQKAINLDHVEQLVVEQREQDWMVKGMDRYASYFWFGPFESEAKAKHWMNMTLSRANLGSSPEVRS